MNVGTQGTLRCLGKEQLKNGKALHVLSGHGNHSLKPEAGEKEQKELLNATLLLPSSKSQHLCSLHNQVSAQVCIGGLPVPLNR